MRISPFLAELARRRVFRVAGGYLVAAWIVLQVADTVSSILELPAWAGKLVLALVALGFLVALALAWAFDVTPTGVVRTGPADETADPVLEPPGSADASPAEDRPALQPALPAVSRRRARQLAPAAVLGLVVALGAGVLAVRERGTPPRAATASRTTVAVLPFTVRGGLEVTYLREGVVDLLSTKLDGAGELRAANPHALLDLMESERLAGDVEGGRVVARRLGARYFVTGTVLQVGEVVQVSATLHPAEGGERPAAQAEVRGPAERLLDLMDDLARQLLAGLEGGPDRSPGLTALTTPSLPALRAYLEGERLFRAAHWDEAYDAFLRAVAADSGFALAYYRLAVVAGFTLGETSAAADSLAGLALRHGGRLSPRERQLVQALSAARGGDADRAESLYRAILATNPDEVEAWFQLGDVLFHHNGPRGRRVGEAREPLERVLGFDPEHGEALVHLIELAALERDYAAFAALLERLDPQATFAPWARVVKAFALQGEDARQRVLAELDAFGDVELGAVVGHATFLLEDLDGAERVARLLTVARRSRDARAAGHVLLAQLHLARGRWRDAERALAEAAHLDPVRALEHRALLMASPFLPVPAAALEQVRQALRRPLPVLPEIRIASEYLNPDEGLHPQLRVFLLGLLAARSGNGDEALARAAELERMAAPTDAAEVVAQLAGTLRAELARVRGDPAQALAELDRKTVRRSRRTNTVSLFHSGVYGRFLRAELLHALGRDQEALAWYESFTEHSSAGVIYLAPAHLRRGQLHERLGRKEEAAAEYARFIELWRNCDPEFQPRVEEARRRLIALARELPTR